MRFIHLDSCESTNLTARQLAEQGDHGPFWVQANSQTGGRGRRGRDWVSKTGNLYASGVYPFDGSAEQAALTSFVAALSVADALEHFVTDAVSLKWPNDVLIDGAKVSGILLERMDQAVIVGIGINLMSHPEDTIYPATHVLEHMSDNDLESDEPKIPEPRAVLAILARAFTRWFDMFQEEGFGPIRNAWTIRAQGLPGRVTVNLEAESFSGQAQGLGYDGALQVRLDNGTIRDIHAGDVFFERT